MTVIIVAYFMASQMTVIQAICYRRIYKYIRKIYKYIRNHFSSVTKLHPCHSFAADIEDFSEVMALYTFTFACVCSERHSAD